MDVISSLIWRNAQLTLINQVNDFFCDSVFILSATIASQDYYKTSVQLIRDHQLASETLGKPLRFTYMNLTRKDIKINHKIAQVSKRF